MVSLINLGNITADGRRASGIASGIDTEQLITSLIELRRKPAVELETTKTKNTSAISALGTLKSKLDTVKNALNALRNPRGVGVAAQNIFKARQAFVTSNTSIVGTTYLGVTTEAGATIANYNNVTVNNIALNKIQQTSAGIYASNTSSVTDAAATNNANRFSAGTFQISGPTQVDVNTATNDALVNADFKVVGSVNGTLLDSTFGTGGIGNITVTSGTGDRALIGELSKAVVTATQIGGAGADVTLTLTLNGQTYISNAVPANTGGGSNEVAANTTITFTNSSTNTSFQVRTAAARVISNSTELSQFAAEIDSGLAANSALKIYQQRTISTFDEAKATGTTLDGLLSSNVLLDSDNFDPYLGTHGKIGGFTVTHTGVDNNSITVKINGETYTATGLLDTLNTNITLVSTTDANNGLKLNLADAGVTLDLSSNTTAKTVQKDLNTVFGTGVNITLTEGDSLNDIANKINSQSNISKVSASVIKFSDTDYRLTLQSNLTGVENAYVLNDVVDDVFSSTVTLNNTQTAEDASITINGSTITRASNTISDVVDKVTFNLFQETPGGTLLKVDIDKNITAVADAITTFAEAYNDFKTFAAEQQAIDPETALALETAFLKDSSSLGLSESQLSTALLSTVTGLSTTDLKALGELGITTTTIPAVSADSEGNGGSPAVAGALLIDAAKLTNALNSNFEGVRKVFELDFNSSDNNKLQIFQSSNKVTINNFDVDIDIGRAVGDQVRITYKDEDGNPVIINADYTGNSTGGLIVGQEGTVIEGLEILYVGDGTDVINNNSYTQGIADKAYNIADPFSKLNGDIDTEVESLNREQSEATTEIARIDRDLEIFRQFLLDQFSKMEQAIAQANQILQLLDAQQQARSAANA